MVASYHPVWIVISGHPVQVANYQPPRNSSLNLYLFVASVYVVTEHMFADDLIQQRVSSHMGG